MTASLPDSPEPSSSSAEGGSERVEPAASTPAKPRAPRAPRTAAPRTTTPRAPRRTQGSAAAAPSDASGDVDASTAPAPKPRAPRTPRAAGSTAATPRTPAVKKPAAAKATGAKTTAAKTTAAKTAASKTASSKTASSKTTAAGSAGAKAGAATPAAKRPAAKKPATPRTAASAAATGDSADTIEEPIGSAPAASSEDAAASPATPATPEMPESAAPVVLADGIVVPPRPPLPGSRDVSVAAAADGPVRADDAEGTDAADSADEREPVSADPTAADPTPADVALEEPIVGEAAVEGSAVEEPAAGEPVAADPMDEASVVADPTVEQSVAADPVAADPVAADPVADETALPDASNGAVTEIPALHDDGVPSERAADATADGSDERTLVLDMPDVPAGPTGDAEDPTPPDVRVEELTGDSSPVGHLDDPVVPASEQPVLEDPASPDARVEEPIGDDAPAAGGDEAGDPSPPDGPASETPASLDDLTGENAPAADDDEAVDPSTPEASTIEDPASVPAASDDENDGVDPAAEAAATVEQRSADDDSAAVPVLSLRTVSKSFGELRAVDAIDLTVPAGSFYGLVGPNGAGKTTTLSIIAGLLRADSGTVSINGVDATKRSREAKKLIGVLPDRLRTFDRLTGRQLLSYYGALRGLPAPLVESRTADLARAFDLVDALARPVSDYSAGMTKKVMLAGAMIHSPRLLVLDEPFEAVDPVSSGVILDILGSYVDHGGTVILSSHGMELVERVCSRVAVIVSGQVLAEGTVDEVRGEATLEQRFLELAGGLGDVEGLEWLHTFSA